LDKERSASDVLLSIEERVEVLEGAVKSIDHNVKLLLSRQNAKLAASSVKLLPSQMPAAETPTPAQPQAEAPTVEAVEFVQVQKDNPNAKRVVQEKLTYMDSKVIILAQVEIFNMNGECIDTRRTNNTGKWTSSLRPGKYTVRVAKQQTSVKPQVTGQYDIVVPPGNKPLQLENRKL
jgi:hypothetical protein